MKFGVRQIANVVFRATQNQIIGNHEFKKGQPVFYLDTAKTSSMQGAATSVYATGGRGNSRLIAWEGQKTLTFTVEDALLSPISFAMLSGAGVVKGTSNEQVHFHQTTLTSVGSDGIIDLTNVLEPDERVDDTAPFFVMNVDQGGDLTGGIVQGNFALVKDSSDDSINGKQITYNGNTRSSEIFTDFNKSKKAFKFPYGIRDSHTATTEEIEGWEKEAKNSLNPSLEYGGVTYSTAYLSQPIPEKYLEKKGKSYIIPESCMKVINSDTGETHLLNLPEALRKPTLTGAEINAAFGKTVNGIDTSSVYQITSYTIDGTERIQPDTLEGNVTNPKAGLPFSFYKKSLVADVPNKIDVKTGASDPISLTLTVGFRNYIIQKYFGVDIIENSTTNKDKRELIEKSFAIADNATVSVEALDKLSGQTLMIDYYVIKPSASVTELQIDAENFAGSYYVEADTLFRRQLDGKDLPANLTFPNVKIQSNFTFSMASTGDPSTFTFTMDAFPGYTYFDKTKKVLCAIQIVDDQTVKSKTQKSIFPHKASAEIEVSKYDSSPRLYNENDSTWEQIDD